MMRASSRLGHTYTPNRDPLTVVVMNRMLAGLSTRKYAGGGTLVTNESRPI
jgi:hypothetical protein